MMLGIIILIVSVSVFSLALLKAYNKDRKEKRKIAGALFEMN